MTDITETNRMEMAKGMITSCAYGWRKETTLRDLRQHQRIRRCPQADQMQPRTAKADETSRDRSQVEHHNAIEPTVAYGHNPPQPPDTNPLVGFQAAERAPATENRRKEKEEHQVTKGQ